MTSSDAVPGDLLRSRRTVPVAGGELAVGLAGPDPDKADVVVLAIHGITSNLMVWGSVVRQLAGDAELSIVAPDLRGRGESSNLGGPYGIAAHVDDMFAVLDHFGLEQALLAGHSMGAYVAARMAGDQPERTLGLVLVDGGPSVDAFTPDMAAAVRTFHVGPALVRHAMPYASADAYLDFWRQHPAFVEAWNDDVEAYVLHDLMGSPGAMRYVINLGAIETDAEEMVTDPANRTAMDRVQVPVSLLRAQRGALDDDRPMIPRPVRDEFAAEHPEAQIEDVDDVNHYTVLLGNSPGPARVAGAIRAAAGAQPVRIGSRL
jgi:pimeloyl-ACP methyl ester carboxylesterase